MDVGRGVHVAVREAVDGALVLLVKAGPRLLPLDPVELSCQSGPFGGRNGAVDQREQMLRLLVDVFREEGHVRPGILRELAAHIGLFGQAWGRGPHGGHEVPSGRMVALEPMDEERPLLRREPT